MNNDPILLIGSPRSGTTWIGKIFDSHPDVIYRHEPDSLPNDYDIPFLPIEYDDKSIIDNARQYVRHLAGCGKLRAVGGPPYFGKSYRSKFANLAFKSCIYAIKGLNRLLPALELDLVSLPVFLKPGGGAGAVAVIKSVSSLGRIGLFARACPEMPMIYIIRHPCGYVASRLRGIKLNVMSDAAYEQDLCRLPEARQLGWTLDDVAGLSAEERFAFSWSVLNERAMRVAEGNPRIHTVFYEDLCLDPQREAERMFDFAGLRMCAQTRAFIAESVHNKKSDGYYRVYKNSREQIHKWRKELSPRQISRIMDVVSRSRPGKAYAQRA